ncbi:hypothetical protein [Anaerococcus obesiensis]|uniref:hypothetical protein n=1 Tax=Anaerococcus obesiensis TaxID=1287640 RepID=UPI00031171EC|nr:hypothetical protein [Anaerococcus obesiensis]
MNKNKKIISASLALALGVSLLIPDAKANEEKTLEKILKEPAKTSETVKTEEKPTVEDKKITIKKAPVNEKGEEKPDDETEKPDGETEKPEGGEEKPDGETGKPDDKTENPETNEEKPKDEKKVKPKEYKMSELLNEKGAFEKCKQGELGFLGFEIMNGINGEPPAPEEEVDAMRRKYEKLQKATTWEEMGKILGYGKEYFARNILSMKGEKDAYDENLVKIIDDMANQKPQNPSKKILTEKIKKQAQQIQQTQQIQAIK